VGELVTRITYADALSGEEANDLIKRNEEAVRLTTEAVTKVYLVNIIPMCMLILMPTKPLVHLRSLVKYVPAWVPGAGFQRLAAHVKGLAHAIRNDPWKNVLKDIVS
jgi:hypothetical protein